MKTKQPAGLDSGGNQQHSTESCSAAASEKMGSNSASAGSRAGGNSQESFRRLMKHRYLCRD